MSHSISPGSCTQLLVGRHLFLHARFCNALRGRDKCSSSPILEPAPVPNSSFPKPVICLLGCYTYFPVSTTSWFSVLLLRDHYSLSSALPSVEHLGITAELWTLSQGHGTCHSVSLPETRWWHFPKYITPEMESPGDFQQILIVPRLCPEGCQ